jgi:glycosyltransferase involved in cell wall biosynthesis
MAKIICTVTNDLVYDQRMQRICTSLAHAGYDVLLLGRKHSASPALTKQTFDQQRFRCWFTKGKLFYIEYNIKLFILLLFRKADVYCAIDLDSIMPNYFVSKLKGKKRVYDAHELFCEMEEITSRPLIYKIWKGIEKTFVPKFTDGYTIGKYYALEFEKMYGVQYSIVRNATVLDEKKEIPALSSPTYILYQGAVNEGRSFQTLIPAMQFVNIQLIICGKGNYFEQTKQLIEQYKLQEKVILKGYIDPKELKSITANAYCGITLLSNNDKSRSNYLSMGNRFFDYMHGGVPQVAVAYPEYIDANKEKEVAILVEDLRAEKIAEAINTIVMNRDIYEKLHQNALELRKKYCWQQEEKTLLLFYKKLLG